MSYTTVGERTEQGAELMRSLIQHLLDHGYRRVRVDTLANDKVQLRHHYSGGEWTLTVIRPKSGSPSVLRWTNRNTIPTLQVVLADLDLELSVT